MNTSKQNDDGNGRACKMLLSHKILKMKLYRREFLNFNRKKSNLLQSTIIINENILFEVQKNTDSKTQSFQKKVKEE